jgi:hypothetical protein
MQKVKIRLRCKLPSMTTVFLPRYQEACKLSSSPHWSLSQGIPRKGQAPGQVTPWIAPGLPHAQVGLWCAFWQASLGPLPSVFTIKLLGEPLRALFPSVHGGSHTTNAVGMISQDYKAPLMYNNGACKHRVIRGVQTSLNTRPKSRASA